MSLSVCSVIYAVDTDILLCFYYFKGEPANRQCPTCSHISATDEEFMDHLWTHKENESGEHIAPDDKYICCISFVTVM